MELTRRDALAALSAAGVAAGAGGAALLASRDDSNEESSDGEGPLTEGTVETLVAAGEVLYPSPVENVGAFVREYAQGKARARPDHASGVADAVAYLDEYCQAWYDETFAALDPDARTDALERMNADVAEPDPAGSDVQRVRYYVVNDLLYALYTSPTGGELVGIENPVGHPGGHQSYQRGPQA